MTTANVFRTTIIKPVLAKMNLGGEAAEELLLGTAVQESMNFKYRRQMSGGPAVGYYQMEPATHDDIWNNFLKYRTKLANAVSSFLTSPTANKHSELETNDKYATGMARIHYSRVPVPLPAKGDLIAQANYWKQYYNTPLGKGLPKEYIHKWNLYVVGGKP
jgi:hypothetical protein